MKKWIETQFTKIAELWNSIPHNERYWAIAGLVMGSVCVVTGNGNVSVIVLLLHLIIGILKDIQEQIGG